MIANWECYCLCCKGICLKDNISSTMGMVKKSRISHFLKVVEVQQNILK